MKEKHLDLQSIILVFLSIFCVISYAIDSKESKCSLSFDSSFTSLLKEHFRITRDKKYIEDQTNISVREQELIDKAQKRISHEEPSRVLEFILDKKEDDTIRESAIELLSEVLIDFNDIAIKQKYINEETVKVLSQIFFDKTNNDRIRGDAVFILCFLYTKMDIGNVPVLFLRQVKRILFDENESEIVKRDMIANLNLIKDPSVINMLKEILVDKKQPESVQISAMKVLAESKTSNLEIISILINKLLDVPLEELDQQYDMTQATVKALYALAKRSDDYRPVVEELINIIFFGMRTEWQAPTSLRVKIIPPLDWPLGSLQTYRPMKKIFYTRSEDTFVNTDTLMKQRRNQMFLTLEYSTTFSLVHTLYFLLFSKMEDNILRMRILHRLYVENHSIFPYILAGIVSDKRESELMKVISLSIMQDVEVIESLFSLAVVQSGKKSPVELEDTLDHFSNKKNKAKKTSDTQATVNRESRTLVLKKAKEGILRKMQSDNSADPIHQQFLQAVSQPDVIKNKLLEFVADPKNKDPIMKGLILCALNEWGMLDYAQLVKIASDKGVDFNIRIMVIRKIIDDLSLILKKKASQQELLFLAKGLVKIFIDPSESSTLRELSAMALSEIKPSDPKLQQRVVTYLSDHRDLTNQELLPYFQWINDLPEALRLPDNMVKIK